MGTPAALAVQVMQRIAALAQITDEPGRLTRTYGSPSMARVNELVAGWMREAGMTTHLDAIGNILGQYGGTRKDAKILLLGSHLDTVRDAGSYDGPLGVLVALACVERLHQEGRRLPFHVGVAGFADEEGVRFHSTYLGSRALTGSLTEQDLARTDAAGISLREAILQFRGDPSGLYGAQLTPDQLLGFGEVHIEQGPILQSQAVPLGVVTAIAGQTRIEAVFTGRAAHAGTTPMALRQDALVAAARFVVAVETLARETPALTATVGCLENHPNASNVIPGRVRLTVDVRHAQDDARAKGVQELQKLAVQVASACAIQLTWHIVQDHPSVRCAEPLTALLKRAATRHVPAVPELSSGAGHDAVALAAITPVAMLFVRCKDGISHHPDESVQEADVAMAIAVMGDFLGLLAQDRSFGVR